MRLDGRSRPSRTRCGLWRPGRSAARRSAGRSRTRRRTRSLVAAVLRSRDAFRHLQLPCARLEGTIDSPLVTVPNFLVAMNEPSLRKFDLSVKPGGWVIYNGDVFPEDCERNDVNVLALNFTRAADELGDPRAPTWSCSARCLKSQAGCRKPASMRLCAAWSNPNAGICSTNVPWREGANLSRVAQSPQRPRPVAGDPKEVAV